MNRIRYVFAVLTCLLVPSAISYVNKSAVNQKMIYCPQSIECIEERKLSSCKLIGDNPEYWASNSYEGGRVVKGTYTFEGAETHYQYPYDAGGNGKCYYNNFDSGFKKRIYIYLAWYANLEAFYDKTTLWSIVGYSANCSGDSKRCPLVEKPEVLFTTSNSNCPVDISIYANDILLQRGYPNDISLNYDKAVTACAGMEKCKIEVVGVPQYSKSKIIGSVLIDLSNNMKILSVTSDPSNTFGRIEKMEPFNTVQVVY